jgi:hypothetical protein
MQSSSGSKKTKAGRPKKPKASDYKANMSVVLHTLASRNIELVLALFSVQFASNPEKEGREVFHAW